MTTVDPPRRELPPDDERGAEGASLGADGADGRYNLASRVYGNGNDNGRANGNGRSDGDGNAAYNLASRVYGNGDANGDGNANGDGDAPYNLASRIYGNGTAAAPLASAVATLPRAAAPVTAPAPAGEPPRQGRKFSLRTFDSLKVVGYRWYLLASLGQMASMNMQMLVRSFLVFELTGSYAALGTMALGNAIPGLMFALFGGVIADRLTKRYVLQLGQAVNAANALMIGTLLLMGMLRFEHLLGSAVVQGTVMALMMPSRQAMIPDVVGRNRLMNAVALNMAGMNFMRLSVPAAGGLLLAAADAYWVYFLMTGLYLFASITLTKVPKEPVVDAEPAAPAGASAMAGGRVRGGMRGGWGGGGMGGGRMGGDGRAGTIGDVKDGLAYIARTRTIRTLLLVNFFIVLLSMPYMMMLAGFVKQVLDGGPDMLGLLMSITGIGSLVGSLVIASLPSRNRGKILLFGSMLLGVALIGFSMSSNLLLTAGIMVFVGVGQATRMSLTNVLIQSYVEDAYRGRVMSIYMMEFSLMQFGVFGVGMLAAMVGIQWALGLTSVALLLFTLYAFAFVPGVRDLD